MKIGIEKAILASAVLWVLFIALFGFQMEANPSQTVEFYRNSRSIMISMWLWLPFAAISVLLSWYDIVTSKNETTWKIMWAAIVLIVMILGIFIYVFVGRKSRMQ